MLSTFRICVKEYKALLLLGKQIIKKIRCKFTLNDPDFDKKLNFVILDSFH